MSTISQLRKPGPAAGVSRGSPGPLDASDGASHSEHVVSLRHRHTLLCKGLEHLAPHLAHKVVPAKVSKMGVFPCLSYTSLEVWSEEYHL